MVTSFLGGVVGGAGVQIVIQAIDKYSAEMKKAEKEAHELGTEFDRTGFIASNITTAGLAAAGGAALAFGVSATKAAIELEPLKNSFNALTDNSDGFLASLKDATRGTVSELDTIRTANNALLLGIEQNKLPELFENASIVAKATGRTTTEAIGDITIGIGRQSKLILDNLGIIVDAEKAYDDYAAALGKASSELTENEKKMAFTNETMRALEKSASVLADTVGNTTSEKLAVASAAWEDFKARIGTGFAEALGGTITAFQDFNTVLEDFTEKNFEIANDQDIQKARDMFGMDDGFFGANALHERAEAIRQNAEEQDILNTFIGEFGKELDIVGEELKLIEDQNKITAESYDELASSALRARDAMSNGIFTNRLRDIDSSSRVVLGTRSATGALTPVNSTVNVTLDSQQIASNVVTSTNNLG